MPKYLSSQTIGAAIKRLINSRAKSGFVDFLVLKRALARANAKEVPFSSNNEHFTSAMTDLAATYPPGIPSAAPVGSSPFVKVFGTADSEKYVTRKWLTNGPADTLSGPNWTGVVKIKSRNPRRGSLVTNHESSLASLLLKAGSHMPKLVDAAIWFYRNRDIDSSFGEANDAMQLGERLCVSFKNELELTNAEIEALFDAMDRPLENLPLSEIVTADIADPQDYLPDLGGGSGELNGMLAAFEASANDTSVGLRFNSDILLRFTAALGAKRFLILSGLAGSGKTKLAQAFARWLSPVQREGVPSAYAVIPVGADWTGNDNILGYPDGLDPKHYVSRPALDLIQRAGETGNLRVPHFLILDEMNLSHVERYFADLLSLIESGEAAELYRPDVDDEGVIQIRSRIEPMLRLPPNVFIIGTVNVDETTYMFSPKVLDRANVIEFRMLREDLVAFLAAPRSPALDKLNGGGSGFGPAFVAEVGKSLSVPSVLRETFELELLLFFDLLRDHNAEFGFRVANEASRFMHFYRLLGGFAEDDVKWFDKAMDAVVVQKLLPKLHGSRSRLEGLLWALAWACGAKRGGLDRAGILEQCRKAGLAQEESRFGPEMVESTLADAPARYPLSFDKIMRMWRKLIRDQFVTFSDA